MTPEWGQQAPSDLEPRAEYKAAREAAFFWIKHSMPRPKDIQAIYATSPNSCVVVLGGNYKARNPAKTLCLVCTEDLARHSVTRQWVECESVFGSTAVEWRDLSQPMRNHIVSDMAKWARATHMRLPA